MSQLNKWMIGQKISKLVIVFTGKETGENVERWQFDVSRRRESAPISPFALAESFRLPSTNRQNPSPAARLPIKKTPVPKMLLRSQRHQMR
jgi:mitotic spindle assembly checkpoint protein MAD2